MRSPEGLGTGAASSSPRARRGWRVRYGSAVRRRGTTLVLATVAAALLTGCTSEVSGSASPATTGSPATSTATSTATATGSPGDADEELREEFCADVPMLLQDVGQQLQDVETDPASASEALDDAVSRLEEVQPPGDVADEWNRLVDALRDLRDLVASVDPSDPGGGSERAEELLDIQSELVDAGTAVDEWGQANC